MKEIITKIYKYELELEGKQTLELPRESNILDIQIQYNKLVMWALVPIEFAPVPRVFEILGTGSLAPEYPRTKREHLKTFQVGPYVWHIFELKEGSPHGV